ncbi:MAG: sigma-70 family RNA polymerase sigma factor, partial [Chloroflexota bacterium]|nr:sigma-70 family RNA polymerase sigma factor [Chloroflexota bacterium]
FKTWLFRILVNQAKRRGAREARSVPFSALARAETGSLEPAVNPDRFLPAGHEAAGHWAAELRDWRQTPEDVVLAQETRAQVRLAIADLPPGQRLVITMRDLEGWSADEVCNALTISETNQRVLLHRARSKVRRALERYLEGA